MSAQILNCKRCGFDQWHLTHESVCHICKEDEKVTRFLAPFEVPKGQLLDDQLFPVSNGKVLTLTKPE